MIVESTAPIELKTEHRENPIGLSVNVPRLSWTLQTTTSGRRQLAYQIVAGYDPAALEADGSCVWNTGRVTSDQTVLIPYAGMPLGSAERLWWRVRVWDSAEAEPSPWSATAFWETGLLKSRDWKANWVSFPIDRKAMTSNEGLTLSPCPFLRREFTLPMEVSKARVYASARGVYRLHINGQVVGNGELAPGWTDYRHRIQYQTYDITDLLVSGQNVVSAELGEGWYCGYVGFRFRRDCYGDRPELLVQLNAQLQDGTEVTVTTDESWKGTIGPIIYSDMLVGERYDARQELAGWDRACFDDSAWSSVHAEWTPATAVPFVGQPDLPVRVTQDVVPISIRPSPDNTAAIVDMGQNMVGRVRLHVEGEAGTTVRLRFAEILQPDGALYTSNLRSARQTDEYVLRGSGPETYEPLFTFHGFRYVEVSGYPTELRVESITGRVMESEMKVSGQLETGHPMVSKLIRNIEWGQRGNFLSVPTDCPQRDERLGWMGDAQVFVRTAAYNRNVAAFFTKWMDDVADAQSPQGSFPNIAPSIAIDGDGAPAWGDAGVIVPWTIYLMYGDRGILEKHYRSMSRWIDYLFENNPDGIWRERSSYNFSDWLSLDAQTPPDVLATAYFAYDAFLMSQIASVLGREADAERFAALFAYVREAFQREFVHADGTITGDTQTCYLLALKMNLLPERLRRPAADHLVANIKARGGHLSTGFIGVGYLCPVLSEAGFSDVAYQLLLNETFPSWGYSIKHGATTIWERWDGWTEDKGFQDPSMNSFNHYSLGSVGEWLYRYAAGIDVAADSAGFQRFLLRPTPDARLGFLRARFESPYGLIQSYWRFEGDAFIWEITVPANTTATAYVPAHSRDAVTIESAETSLAAPIEFLRMESGCALFRVAPGSCRFRV